MSFFHPLFEEQVCKSRGTDIRKTRIISSQLLDKIEEHTGFFLKRGTNENGQDVYGFLHPTFAEYLTARYLAQRWVKEHRLEFADTVHEASWHEVVLLMAGHLGTLMDILATRLVEEIEKLESPYEKHLHRDLLLVAEIIGDNVPVAREKREEIVLKLISLALDTSFESLFRSIHKRLNDIAKAFPFASQPKQLKHQEGDSVAQRVRKTILARGIGIRKEADIEVLFPGLFADDETKNLVTWALTEYENNYERKNETLYVLVIEQVDGMFFYSMRKRAAERIIGLQLPIFDVEALLGKSIISDSDRRVWLLDLQQVSYFGPSKLASSSPLDERGRAIVRSILSFYDNPSVATLIKC